MANSISNSTAIKVATLILFAFFVRQIALAGMKLQEHKIGTSVTRKNARRIPYPTMTFCPFHNKYSAVAIIKFCRSALDPQSFHTEHGQLSGGGLWDYER